MTRSGSAGPADLAAGLDAAGYLPDAGMATAAFLAWDMRRPLFLEGEPGVGKTSLARAMATVLGAQLERLQCYSGIDASQALYDWNFPKQILTMRSATDDAERSALLASIYTPEFLLDRPILRALRHSPSVLLIDEIDRADDEFEAFLLEVLDDYTVSIPEMGPVKAQEPPLVVLTSNRTREVHDALKRRCLYHWVDHPDLGREIAIVRRHTDGKVPEELAGQVATLMRRLRSRDLDLRKPPGIAEAVDAAVAMLALGRTRLDAAAAAEIIGTFLKHHEDAEKVRPGLAAYLQDAG